MMNSISLSPLESAVLNLWNQGKAYDEIAATLSISHKSVDNAMQRIRRKRLNPKPRRVGTPQQRRALKTANKARMVRAAIKQSIKAGQQSVVSVLEDFPQEAAGMELGELVLAQRGWGKVKVNRLLGSCEISENAKLSELSALQLQSLITALTRNYT